MKKLAIIGAVILVIGILTAACGFIAAKGDISVLDINAGYWYINTGRNVEEELTERVFSADRFKNIELSTLSDNVMVGESNDGLVHFSYWSGRFKDYTVDEGGDTLTLRENRTKAFGLGFSFEGGQTTLLLPSGTALDIKVTTVSGDADITSDCRTLDVGTTSGNVKLAGEAEKLTVKTVSGNVYLRGFDSRELKLSTVSGNIGGTLAGSVDSYSVKYETVSGNVNLKEKNSGDRALVLSTVSGNMEIGFTE